MRKHLIDTYNEMDNYGKLYNLLAPEVFCTGLARIGTEGDGGKWVCNPFIQQTAPCSIYSLGINNEISFDVQIQQITNKTCRLHAYDMGKQIQTVIDVLKIVNADFHVAKIAVRGNITANAWSISDLMTKNGDKEIEMLKMDIEGGEFDILPSLVNSTKICQIFVEVHGTAFQMVQLLKTISRSRFYLFSYEINGFYTTLCEFSFIHESCLSKYGVDVILGRYLS